MQINCVSEDHKISKIFWTSALVEAGAAQDTGSCMLSTRKMSYHKWEGSRFTLALLHNFTLVKVKNVAVPHRVDLFTSCKNLFLFKNVV